MKYHLFQYIRSWKFILKYKDEYFAQYLNHDFAFNIEKFIV